MAYTIRTTSNFFVCAISYAFFCWGLFALYCIGYQLNRLRVYYTRKDRISGNDAHVVKPIFHSRYASYLNTVVAIPFVTEMIPIKHIIGVSLFTIVNLLFIFFAPFTLADGVDHYILASIGLFDRRAAFVGMVNWGFVFFLAQRNSILPKMSGLTVEELLPFHRWIARIGMAQFIPHFVYRMYRGYIENYVVADALFLDEEYTSGTISMIGFLLMFVTSLEYIRRNYFEVFYYCHVVGMLIGMAFGCWHEHTCLVFFVPALMLWFVDRIVRSYQSWYIKSTYMKVEQAVPQSASQEGIVRILFQNEGLSKFKPGQYMFISIVQKSRKIWEYANWHPITVSETFHSSNNIQIDSAIEERVVGSNMEGKEVEKMKDNNNADSIGSISDIDSLSDVSALRRRGNNYVNEQATIGTFHIKALGGKTRDLLKASAANQKVAVRIDGPYGPHLEYQDYQVVALYAAGIGITPALAIVKDCVERRTDGVRTVAVEHIYLTWAIRSSDEIAPFMDMFTYWVDKTKNSVQPLHLHVSVYVTRMTEGPEQFEGVAGFNTIYGERPNIQTTMDMIKTANPRQRVWAHACGSFAFTKTVINEAIRHDFDAHNETFEF